MTRTTRTRITHSSSCVPALEMSVPWRLSSSNSNGLSHTPRAQSYSECDVFHVNLCRLDGFPSWFAHHWHCWSALSSWFMAIVVSIPELWVIRKRWRRRRRRKYSEGGRTKKHYNYPTRLHCFLCRTGARSRLALFC